MKVMDTFPPNVPILLDSRPAEASFPPTRPGQKSKKKAKSDAETPTIPGMEV